MTAQTSPDYDLLQRLLLRARAGGMPLGITELVDARDALAAGFGAGGEENLRRLLHLLWCSSAAQTADLDAWFDEVSAQSRDAEETAAPVAPPGPEPTPQQAPGESPAERPPRPRPEPATDTSPLLMPLPVRAPVPTPLPATDEVLRTYYPVSRRTMAYAWRNLRRPVKDGPPGPIDLSATVERAARLGFFDQPVRRRKTSDHAHLVLLLDQGGSMVPFHRFTRDLVDSVADSGLGRVDLAYFHNVPADSVYHDPARTRRLPLTDLLGDCDAESCVLLVSDAGAARGGRVLQRVRATTRLLVEIKRRTNLVAWLNPMPIPRWSGSSAQLIHALVAMFPMDPDGFGNIVDVLRGQTPGQRP